MIATYCGINRFKVIDTSQKQIASFVTEYGDLALERFDGTETDFDTLAAAVESVPFLVEKKLVVITDLSLNKTTAERIEGLLAKIDDSVDVIVVEGKLDKRSVYYKTLKKLTDFNEYAQTDDAELSRWIVVEAKNQQAQISASDARYLIERVGNDQLRLHNEILKLSQYNSTISRSTIDLLTDESPSSTIFNLIDSIFAGDTARALAIYNEQRRQRVEPQAIQAMLVWQMHAVAIISVTPRDVPSATIAKEAGLSPFVVQKSQRIAHAMGREGVVRFLRLLRDIDYKSKNQTFDYDEALRYCIIDLAN